MSAHKFKIEEFYHFAFVSLSIGVLSLSMFLVSKHFDQIKPQVEVLGAQIDLEKEQKFWREILTKQPTYRDGWVELAKIEIEMGNIETANKYLERAKNIDPNFSY